VVKIGRLDPAPTRFVLDVYRIVAMLTTKGSSERSGSSTEETVVIRYLAPTRGRFGAVAAVAAAALALVLAPAAAGAPASVYDSAEEFDFEFPGLTFEGFEDSVAPDGAATGCPAPFNQYTDNACYSPGALAPGFSLSDDPLNDANSASANGLAAVGVGFNGAPSRQVVANTLADALVIDFSPSVTTVGFDLVSHLDASDCNVTLDFGSGLTQALEKSCTPTGSHFVGFRSETPIKSIRLHAPGNRAEGIDNLRFGSGPSRADCDAATAELGLATQALERAVAARGKAAGKLKRAKSKLRKLRKSSAPRKKVKRVAKKVRQANRELKTAKQRVRVAQERRQRAVTAVNAACGAPA
jgi:hypothetical protein